MDQVSFFTAIGAGLISFISPCVLPLVPPYLCYMAGVSLEELASEGEPRGSGAAAVVMTPVLVNALYFVAGFTFVFVALGATASTLGQLVRSHSGTLSMIAGVIIIVMGLHFLGIFRIGLLHREARYSGAIPISGLAGSFLMGLAFAFGWTPCIGPILGVILAIAGSKETIGEGAALLAAYSAGLGIPFLLAAGFVRPFMAFLVRFRPHLALVEKAMGGMLVLAGILFLTGFMQTASFWLLDKFPALGAIG